MKHEFKEGDGVVCSSNREANEILQLLIKNGYSHNDRRTNDICLEYWRDRGGKLTFIGANESDTTFTNKIPKEEFIKLITGETMTKERKLTRENFKRIYNVACSTWKTRLELKFKDFSFKDEIIIEESYYQEMRKACTEPQHKLFDEIFGKDDNLITGADLKMGEAMLVTEEGRYKDSLVFKSTGQGIFLNSTSQIEMGQFSSNEYLALKGKRVKLNISYEVIN